MNTPSPLSAEQLARITLRVGVKSSDWLGDDRRSLLNHIAWQAERLAESEQAYEAISADRHSIEQELFTKRDNGAAAVLAAADRVYDTEQAFADHCAAEEARGSAGNRRYHEWPETKDHITAQAEMLEAVRD